MSNTKEIRNKIASIKNTQKITRAMEMVAASKMRKTQYRMHASRPYAEKIYQVIGHLAHVHSEYKHPYLQHRDVKNAGYIIVSSDRGLCGGLNANIFKTAIEHMSDMQQHEIDISLCLIGKKAEAYFKRYGGNVLGMITHIGDKPTVSDLIGVVRVMLDAFDDGRLDAIYLVHNQFVNTMSQKPRIEQLLPLPADEDRELAHYWDYIYEPEAKQLLDSLLSRYIEAQVYQAVVENIACEQAARMVAMKSASDNAGDLIEEFQLAYNKARQAAITQEIAEIVSGAAAV